MGDERKILDKALKHALAGTGAHADTKTIFEALDWRLAGSVPAGAAHSVYQLLNHMLYWQDWVIDWFDGDEPALPEHAESSWPGAVAPASHAEWQRAVKSFGRGLNQLARASRRADLFSAVRGKSPLEMLLTIASHNSYHAGQVVALRQQLGAWPPPSGGLTW